MLTIGLTGGIGTGKSLVSEFLKDQGAALINADLLGHEAYYPGTPGFQQVVDAFGKEIVGADGYVDRKKLGPIVFSDPEHMDRLNGIMHPLIKDMIVHRLTEIAPSGDEIVVVEAAILLEAGWEPIFDEIWVVTTSSEETIARLESRNGLSREDAQQRIDSQMSSEERISYADIVLENNGTIDKLKERVEELWKERVPEQTRS